MEDPRTKYRVALDAALAQGDEAAWERYQNAAALALREPEEWLREWPVRGDPCYGALFVSAQDIAMRGGWRAAGVFIDSEFRRIEKWITRGNCPADPASLTRLTPTREPFRNGWMLRVAGVVA